MSEKQKQALLWLHERGGSAPQRYGLLRDKRTANALIRKGMISEEWAFVPGNDYLSLKYKLTKSGRAALFQHGLIINDPARYDGRLM